MRIFYFVSALSLLIFSASCLRQHDHREITDLNNSWKFIRGDVVTAMNRSFDDAGWLTVDLPHDFSIGLPVSETNPSGTSGGYFEAGKAWYRKTFNLPVQASEKTIYLFFDGVYMNSEIWVNGKQAGSESYGYLSRYYDISNLILPGEENVLAVKVDNSDQPVDRWYSGSGIYRDVKLLVVNPVHIRPWGTFVRNTSFSPAETGMVLTSSICNNTGTEQDIKIISHIYNPGGHKIGVVNSGVIRCGKTCATDQNFTVANPDLWSPDHPVLYEAVTDILRSDNTILDTYTTKFGIRQAEFTADSGFVLNGRKLMMKGVCLHHDLGCLGSAYYGEVMRTRLQTLKDLGVNAIRLSHNPYASSVLDLCDEMGFLVIDEMYDKWASRWEGYIKLKEPFMDTWEEDLTSFLLRDRNHPSVVLWSVGNETVEQLDDPDRGVQILELLKNRLSRFDSTRMVTCALHPNGELPSRLMHHEDVVSYNYRVEKFAEWKEEFPEYVFLATETKAYQEDEPEDYGKPDFSKNTWFMLSHADAGQFIWAGIDYLGESPGWPDKGMHSGIINTCGYVKPYGYFTKSLYSKKPFVHLTILNQKKAKELNEFKSWQKKWYGPPLVSHWNFENSGIDSLDVIVFTNLPTVELNLNNRSLGIYRKSDFPGGVIVHRVLYKEGKLTARAWENEEITVADSLQTAGTPDAIHVDTEEPRSADGRQRIVLCHVKIIDKHGVICPTGSITVKLENIGPAVLLGADNGDLADHRLYCEPECQVRDGKSLFIVKRTGKSGVIKLKFSAEGLKGASVTL